MKNLSNNYTTIAQQEENLKDQVWVNADGDEYFVSDLTDEHINNIIMYLESSIHTYKSEWVEILEAEQEQRSKNMFESL